MASGRILGSIHKPGIATDYRKTIKPVKYRQTRLDGQMIFYQAMDKNS